MSKPKLTNRTSEQTIEINKATLERLVFVVILILVFLMAARTPLDTDMWWHMRAGETTVEMGSPLLVDTTSFTKFGENWVNHSWLGGVLLYGVFSIGGFFGLGLLVTGVVTLTIGIVYFQSVGPGLLRGPILILGAVVSSWVWSPRPQIFTLLLFAWVGYLLYLYKWRAINRLWLLIPTFILWSNLHAGYTLGLILILFFLAGEILNTILGYKGEEILDWKKARALIVWTIASGLVVLINPNGIRTWLISFETIRIEVLQQLIDEWSSPNFHELEMHPFLWLFFITLTAMVFAKRRVDGVDLVGLLGFAYMALTAKRNFAPFALFAMPVMARYMGPLLVDLGLRIQSWIGISSLGKIIASKPKLNLDPGIRKVINLILVSILWISALGKLYVVTHPMLVEVYESRYYPTGAVQFLKENPQQGNLFNSYGWGGYLQWHLREYPVFVDGRTDLFGDEIIRLWLDVMEVNENWAHILDRWNIGIMVVEPDRPIVKVLRAEGWQVLYQDEVSIVIVR